MQKLVPGTKRYTLNTGHAPQLAAPEELAVTMTLAISRLLPEKV